MNVSVTALRQYWYYAIFHAMPCLRKPSTNHTKHHELNTKAVPLAELLLKEEVYQIVVAAMEVYYQLGCGFLEPVYQEDLK